MVDNSKPENIKLIRAAENSQSGFRIDIHMKQISDEKKVCLLNKIVTSFPDWIANRIHGYLIAFVPSRTHVRLLCSDKGTFVRFDRVCHVIAMIKVRLLRSDKGTFVMF